MVGEQPGAAGEGEGEASRAAPEVAHVGGGDGGKFMRDFILMGYGCVWGGFINLIWFPMFGFPVYS